MAEVFGLILAGGGARRMGGADKALLMLLGRPLILHSIEAMAAQVGAMAISANGDPARLGFAGLPVLADATPGRGPLEGVLAGLEWAAALAHPDRPAMLATVAVDSPGFPADLVARLHAGGASAAYARCDGRDHPTFALWPLEARAALAKLLAGDERRMMRALAALGARAVDLPPGSIRNLNTRRDLAEAEAEAEAEARGA